MPRNVPFADPSSYLRYMGPVVGENRDQTFRQEARSQLRFIRLNAREGPIRVPLKIANVAPGARSAVQSMSDMVGAPNHLHQVFMGISYGARARFYLPLDERILKLDESALTQVVEQDTNVLEYEDTPIDNPRFQFWVAPGKNFVPAVEVENVLSDVQPRRTIDVDLLFYMTKFTYDIIDPQAEPEIHDKLIKFQIPSKHVSFGGRI